ncbi:phosphoribosyl 1,2-cyclic phosphate phosphodiesterase [Limimonas halophila]|uniref:Phosphoribosyl 1,2-cyclic phosphate phosphodiesterase n=1 Tax=Limimonas halophila TaxID=1082479 RepID=A0A1G7NL23_9PROT|nr:MBL fold metallo-hydrolase [Limimonas halophila]SDF74666.1 phosphoribosyl 1,2-cyclic phosphate phosphodiesterase [Limimonas halophila]
MKLRVLGCGGSGGVPLVGGIWGACDPGDPRNRRRRPSILIEHEGVTILVDTSPDLREQLLDARVTKVDAVLFTHSHADHCHGLDDLRPLVYTRDHPIPAYGDGETLANLRQRFGYAFEAAHTTGALYSALLDAREIPLDTPFEVAGLSCVAFEQQHGPITTLGYRIGPIGYSPDAHTVPENGFAALDGISVWVVDCLRYAAHPSHAHFDRTLSWVRRVQPQQAILTHMNHTLDYADLAANCPPGVEPGVDGLEFEVPADGGPISRLD